MSYHPILRYIPDHGPNVQMLVRCAPTLCFCPLWAWGDCCDAPLQRDASAGHLAGCPESQDTGCQETNFFLERGRKTKNHVVTAVKREKAWILKPFSLPMAISITSLTFLSGGCQDLFHVETVYFNSFFLQMISVVKEFDSDIFISNRTAWAIASPPPPLWKWSFKFLINLNSPLFSRSLKWCHGVTVFCQGSYLGNKTKARSTFQKEPENADGKTFSN